MTKSLPTGHDAETAFDWWDGSRRIIEQEPFDVAVALHAAAPDVSRTAALAAAHVVPVTTTADDVLATTRLIDAWLRTSLEPTALSAQFSMKDDVRAIIAVDGMAECRDLAEGLERHTLTIPMSAYVVRINLERITRSTILCMTAAPTGQMDDMTTIAEIIIGDDRDDDEAGTPERVSPEPVPA